jgi:hypothetical protein
VVLLCSHKDLAKDAAPHFRKAKKFYDGLAAEMVAHGHICDVFSCALDNVSGVHARAVLCLVGLSGLQFCTRFSLAACCASCDVIMMMCKMCTS